VELSYTTSNGTLENAKSQEIKAFSASKSGHQDSRSNFRRPEDPLVNYP
jgi:hypothetical protein